MGIGAVAEIFAIYHLKKVSILPAKSKHPRLHCFSSGYLNR